MRFLLGSENDEIPCPLPITATQANRWRWDPYVSMKHNIFRDRYERKQRDRPRDYYHRQTPTDWPEIGDQMVLFRLHHGRSMGEDVDKARIDELEENLRKITPSSPIWASRTTVLPPLP